MTAIALIGAASGWGAGFRHTQDGPTALRDLGLADWLRAAGIDADWRAMIASERRWDESIAPTTAEIFDLVAKHNAALADTVARTLHAGEFPVVLGGDHTGAMGTWGGVARGMSGKPFGLIWLDAHLDAHTVATSPSMNPHGMPAAALLGEGDPRFLKICGGVLRPDHLCYIGVRVIEMAEVKSRGIAACVAEAHDIVTRGTAGFGVTIDLDGFDPEDAPGIGLKCDDGLRAAPTLAALRMIADDPALTAIEIVEYIPQFDQDRRTAHLVRDLVVALRGKTMPARPSYFSLTQSSSVQ